MSDHIDSSKQIEIRIGNVPFEMKIDALGAAIAAVREAHRGLISDRSWAALHRCQENIGEAILYRDEHKNADWHARQSAAPTGEIKLVPSQNVPFSKDLV